MPVYISDAITTGFGENPESFINPNSPRIGIENLSNKSNIIPVASELPTNPSWLTSTPSTAERFKVSPDNTHVWFCNLVNQSVDYVGIAAHRGLVGRSVEIRCTLAEGGTVTLYGPVIITNSDPIFTMFDPVDAQTIFVRFESAEDFDFELGIINVGRTVALPRNIYVDHTPITYGRESSKLISNSDNGQFLGQISTKTSLKSAVSMANVPPIYYRDELFKKFTIPAETLPFFWAWRPNKYPLEMGFCWTNGDVSASNAMANGYMQIDFQMTGYVDNG